MKVDPSKIAAAINAKVNAAVRAADIEGLVVEQARDRINNGGDSTHTYPELWATRQIFRGPDDEYRQSYRAGGTALRDTGALYSSLTGKHEQSGTEHTFTVVSDLPYAKMHQEGAKTSGPNFIPLTLRAARDHVKGANPKDEGLVLDVDYIIAWKGVTVPQRMIVNMPPENVAEIKAAISAAME